MFENCKTLFELGAARACETEKGENSLVDINNAYNIARQRILTERKPFVPVLKSKVVPRPVRDYVGVPVIGYSTEPGTIQLTPKGFLF